MDKTPKYQKMCVEAFKDIGYIKPTATSNLMIPAPNSLQDQQADDFMLTFEDEFDNIGFGSTVARPVGQLYQQDQLQRIVFTDKSTSVRQMIQLFYTFIKFCKLFCPSMEQLWLAFVMGEKFDKTWDEGELKWTKSCTTK